VVEGDDERGVASGLSETFAGLKTLLLETETVAGFLSDLALLAAHSFPDGVCCSVTLVRDGRAETAVSSDDLAAVADEEQYGEQAGPCLTAFREAREIVVTDLRAETRFGDYPGRAAALGLRSVVALPMSSAGSPVGAFNLYAMQPGVFTDGSLVRARVFAAAAAGAMELARRLAEQSQLNSDLEAALASRRVIDQAIGITMARHGCDAEAAFGVLRRTSQNEHRKLREVAAGLVTEAGGAAPTEGPVFQPARRR
jgi:GAF domain-containing protein